MRVGLLPALGGGLRALARSGQQSRLIDGYFRPYLEAFDRDRHLRPAGRALNLPPETRRSALGVHDSSHRNWP
jgi:hypothetical protein